LHKWYGWLAGLAYTLPYAIGGLVMGSMSGNINRKKTMGICVMISGLCQFFTGRFDSFASLCGMRVLHGAANAATNPLSYSLVADYVPPEKRATANSILGSAIYVGVALSSLSILMIK
jgi:MFS family permease